MVVLCCWIGKSGFVIAFHNWEGLVTETRLRVRVLSLTVARMFRS